jgi:hypothetical protein
MTIMAVATIAMMNIPRMLPAMAPIAPVESPEDSVEDIATLVAIMAAVVLLGLTVNVMLVGTVKLYMQYQPLPFSGRALQKRPRVQGCKSGRV